MDCYNAGARVLHLHVRNPATGHLSAKIEHFNYMMERLKKAVPEMIIQVGGSIAFDHPKDDGQVNWLSYDTRHMLAEITPKPETVTVAVGTCMMDLTQMWTPDDIKGTHLEKDPKAMAAWAGMYTDAGPAFYLEHLKRLREERYSALLHAGACAPARDRGAADPPRCVHGPAEHEHHHVRRRRVRPQSVRLDALAPTPAAGRRRHVLGSDAGRSGRPAMALIMGQHCRVGNEDNLWNSKRERMTTVDQLDAIVVTLPSDSAARLRPRSKRARS